MHLYAHKYTFFSITGWHRSILFLPHSSSPSAVGVSSKHFTHAAIGQQTFHGDHLRWFLVGFPDHQSWPYTTFQQSTDNLKVQPFGIHAKEIYDCPTNPLQKCFNRYDAYFPEVIHRRIVRRCRGIGEIRIQRIAIVDATI